MTPELILLLLLSAAVPLALLVVLAIATDKAPDRPDVVYYVGAQPPAHEAAPLLLEAPEVTQ